MKTLRLTKPFTESPEVAEMQHLLSIAIGMHIDTDGIFGRATNAFLKHFQRENDMMIDGVCGPKTWEALLKFKDNNDSQFDNLIIVIPHGGSHNGVYLQKGKQSVDGLLKEGLYVRELFDNIPLNSNIYVFRPGDVSSSMQTRVDAVNIFAATLGPMERTLAISVHVNAAGNGSEWVDAKGHIVRYNKAPGAMMAADKLSKKFQEVKPFNSKERNIKKAEFTFPNKCKCPALLLEMFFMDNKTECETALTRFGSVVEAVNDTLLEMLK